VISHQGTISAIVEEIASSRAASRAALAQRPRVRLSLFWGPRWDYYPRSGKPAQAVRPRQANQFGRFYPAWRGRRALVDLPWAGRWPRVVSTKGLTILMRYGVPIRLPSRSQQGRDNSAAMVLRCGPREAARLVEGFLSALNRGDRKALAGFAGTGFVVYSVRVHPNSAEKEMSVQPSGSIRGGAITQTKT
jgi:hypothetical protein